MRQISLTLVVFCVVINHKFAFAAISDCKGCVNLDEFSFDKVIPKYEVVVVKFDVAFPYGDKHNTFKEVADEVKDNPNIMFAEVGVKHYGLKENMEFAKRFEVHTEKDLPTIRVFVQGEDEPFVFEKERLWNNESLKKFLKEHTNIYFGLPGCLVKFDLLAKEFASEEYRQSILDKAENELKHIKNEREELSAKNYIKFMKKLMENESFVSEETKRLQKLIDGGKMTDKKKEELSQRLNILQSFAPVKTEL